MDEELVDVEAPPPLPACTPEEILLGPYMAPIDRIARYSDRKFEEMIEGWAFYSNEGIAFRSSKLAEPFLQYFESDYAKKCIDVSRWVSKTFDGMSSDELQTFIHSRIGKWGVEFTDEPIEDETATI